ncbi:hypothetical protein DPEC_G00204130 [Dallia pectoralis]|uniref:Uncharacterized protein n=1 Tax=Dallia pectoralis TaxID=75939 RepID=A0ACC2G9V6_DALPE|nr:hypothetical protein DPEC_G00204130 [Dallia pectoralis]
MDHHGVAESPVILVIKAPNQKYDDQTINCFLNWTVEKLKAHISHVYPSKPCSKDQRLVYSGKLLLDHLTLKEVLRKHDGYHMVHLVCASHTPLGSPKRHQSRGNNAPGAPSTSTTIAPNPIGPTHAQGGQSTGESSDRIRHGTSPAPDHSTHPAFIQRYMWSHFPPSHMPAYSGTQYNPMTLLWWQQVYAQQYHMHNQMLAAMSAGHFGPDLFSTRPGPSDPLIPPPPDDRRGDPDIQMNAQGGEAPLNEDEQNHDWLDWLYTVSRATILLSIIYFYSSFSRFVMVMGAMLLLYLHQAGWFPFNLENELQHPVNGGNQDEMEDNLHHDLREMERLMDQGLEEHDGDSGEEEPQDTHGIPHAGFLSATWSFVVTFFMSLIPEGLPNAAN